MNAIQPSHGDVWPIDFDPIQGREQAGTRPALRLSVDKFNHGPAAMVVVLPVTSELLISSGNSGDALEIGLAPDSEILPSTANLALAWQTG